MSVGSLVVKVTFLEIYVWSLHKNPLGIDLIVVDCPFEEKEDRVLRY